MTDSEPVDGTIDPDDVLAIDDILAAKRGPSLEPDVPGGDSGDHPQSGSAVDRLARAVLSALVTPDRS